MLFDRSGNCLLQTLLLRSHVTKYDNIQYVYVFYRLRKLSWVGLVLLVVCHSCKTYRRNWDWETEYSLFMAGLRVNQKNAKLFNNVGHALESQGHYYEALQFFNKAVRYQDISFNLLICLMMIVGQSG